MTNPLFPPEDLPPFLPPLQPRADIETKPIFTKGQFVVNAGIAERKTAVDYLQELEQIGVLKSRKVGKENLYLNVRLYELLAK